MRTILQAFCLLLLGCGGAAVREQAPPPALRILSYNIRHGRGMDGKVDLPRIAAVLAAAEPDLVALQEVDRKCRRSGGVDEAAELGARLGMEARFGAFMKYQGGEYGMAILSRFPILESRVHRLPKGAEPRCALEVRVRPEGSPTAVSLVCIHHDWTREEFRLRQVEALEEALRGIRIPAILAGDFNAEPEGPSLAFLRKKGWRILGKGGGKTWPSRNPRREIDHFLVRGPWVAVRCEVLPEDLASDHRPVLAVLRLASR